MLRGQLQTFIGHVDAQSAPGQWLHVSTTVHGILRLHDWYKSAAVR